MTNLVQGDAEAYFESVIQFLASAEIVVTNTYHGAYWATLLNRKVIVIAPFSNKFMGFKYEPVIVRGLKDVKDAVHDARRYPEALSDSRELNVAFYQRVKAHVSVKAGF